MDDFWAGCMVFGASIAVACFVLAGAEFIGNLLWAAPISDACEDHPHCPQCGACNRRLGDHECWAGALPDDFDDGGLYDD